MVGVRGKFQRGFTLMELLVVIAIIALLVSILMPSLQSAKALARLAVCQSTMHNLGLGNAMYSADYDEFSVHGFECIGWSKTGNDWRFYPESFFDDDRGASKPGVSAGGYVNLWNNGGQNICGVGQLMWDYYIEETADAIGCPQADFTEVTGYVGTNAQTYATTFQYVVNLMKQPRIDPNNPLPGQDPNDYWRNEYYDGDGTWRGYYYLRCNYVVRGPLFRTGDILDFKGRIEVFQTGIERSKGRPKGDWEIAIFADTERPEQYMMTISPVGFNPNDPDAIPTPWWPRRHIPGFLVAYVDGHVDMLYDENRKRSWRWSYPYSVNETKWYGNGYAMMARLYDAQK